MNHINKTILIIANNKEFARKIRYDLEEYYNLMERKELKFLYHTLRMISIACVILNITSNIIPDKMLICHIRKKFPYIPFMAIISNDQIELARQCGEIGIDKVLIKSEIENIEKELTSLLSHTKEQIFISDLGIKNPHLDYPEIILNALALTEHNYIDIKSVCEIAHTLGVSECTLSREFQKYGLPGPKRLLMHMKVYHASLLMQNKGFNIREIAAMSGFTNDKRMAECFQRFFLKSPGEFRDNLNGKDNVTTKHTLNLLSQSLSS